MTTRRGLQQREVRRQQLLEASREVFSRRGYFETRVADIMRAAAASHGTFYTYFTSKDDVLRVLLEAMVDDLVAASVAPRDRPASPLEGIAATIRQFMHAYRDRAELITILRQVATFDLGFQEMQLAIKGRFIDLIEHGLRSRAARGGRPTGMDPRYAALALGAMVEDTAYSCYVLHAQIDEDLAIATMSQLWACAAGLGPGPDPAGRS